MMETCQDIKGRPSESSGVRQVRIERSSHKTVFLFLAIFAVLILGVALRYSDNRLSAAGAAVNFLALALLVAFFYQLRRVNVLRKENEEALRRLAAFPEKSPDPVLRIAADGSLIYANKPAQAWLVDLGWQAGQLLPVQVRTLRAEAFGKGKNIEAEIKSSGKIFWVNAVRPPGENYVNIYGRDVTERKQAEDALRESEERFRLLIEGASDYAIFMLDPEGRVMTWNLGAARLKGYSAEEIIGQHFSLFFTSEDIAAGRPQQVLALATQKGTFVEEGWRARKDGSHFWGQTTLRALRDEEGKVRGFAEISHDLTERKRAKDQLEEEARRKDEFLTVLSHELRNPLGPIRNAVWLQRRLAPADPTIQRTCQVIERQVAQMARLLEDLLDVSRIKRGKVQMIKEMIDLGEVVRNTAEDHRQLMELNGLTLETDIPFKPLIANADPSRLAQIVGNLINNSIKFTGRGGRVRVQVCESGEQQKALISVRDTGKGIEPKMLHKIFEPFVQIENTLDRSRGGLGLGLALVKGLVEMHGGSVQAQSAGLGQGAEVIIALPLASGQAGSRREQPKAGVHRRRVLLVEDNADAAESLRLLLELNGHEVEVAQDAEEALEKMRQLKPEVIVCDIGLPGGMDGYELARVIRDDKEFSDVYLIAMTGYGTEDDHRQATEAGFDWHLTKPAEPEQIQRLISEMPSRKQSGEPFFAKRALSPAALTESELLILEARKADLQKKLAAGRLTESENMELQALQDQTRLEQCRRFWLAPDKKLASKYERRKHPRAAVG
jgi:PAS domain S-box-containing protein